MPPSVLWQPSQERAASSGLERFRRFVEERHGMRLNGYAELWAWSTADIESFWAAIWAYFEVRASVPYERVLGRREMPGAEWFPGARLSYAEHVFRGHDADAAAIVHRSELRGLSELTWGELRVLAAGIAQGLRERGVGPGDRVAAYLPNVPETIAAFFACASIGAVWSSCAPEFGPASVLDRFGQIQPKVLLAADGYRYGGKSFDRREIVGQIRDGLPSLEHVFVLPYLGSEGNWDELAGEGELRFEQLPFDHPLWVVYSSGTTGLPKPIVHGQGGILLEHLKQVHLHLDAREGDRVFWFTTTGWMMWNFLAGVLLSPAAIVLYDGSPAEPDLAALWQLAADTGTTCFGTSAGYLISCLKAGVEPARGRDLSRLRSIGSTGSPLSPEGFRWVYEQLGPDVWLFSTSGGTDVCTAFVGAVPTLPVVEGELQGRSLGAAVASFDPAGRPLVDEVGELVVTEPMPSMPVFLWGDADGSRYREGYFETYPGVWRHGDWIEITSRGTAVISGRSDSTLNRGGVRIGTSEIYRAALAVGGVIDALAIELPREGSEAAIVLFVVLERGRELDDVLRTEIRARIRTDCSPRHVPDEVRQAPELPRTLSGKLLEVPVRRILAGARPGDVSSRDSLANPAALDWFVELAGVWHA